MTSLIFFGATEGGLFDFDATLPLMAVQVVILTFILNSLFFKPVGKVVEEREDFINTSRSEAKKKLEEVKQLESDLKNQLKEARLAAQKVINEAEEDSQNLYKEALALANADANSSREKARFEIDSQRNDALSKLTEDSDQISDLIVNRLLGAR
tara:strand:+ start:143 stop:604 length:462 start_codon:yes stop_codon:yes gene_type:complete